MTSNSATMLANKPQHVYSDFSAEGGVTWIQSPISREAFEQGSHIVDGIYVQVKPFEAPLPVPAALAQELAAWDAASDEALINFERENL
jgi:hypothetical protein